VELQLEGKIYVSRATGPDEDTLDIKAMELERKHKEIGNAQALYDAIPMIAPTKTQYVTCLDEEKGKHKLVSKAANMALPLWNWTDVLAFSKRRVKEGAK
jgi:hypothetical protein